MRIQTETPFASIAVPGQIDFPAHSLTLVVKGTFDLHPEGVATVAGDQLYPCGDQYPPDDPECMGAPTYASDFAPLKPAADLLLVGTCYAPGGEPVTDCEVAFQIGEHRRALRVSGDRSWEERQGQRIPSRPEPFVSMPLGYGRAFGGQGSELNPVGRGLADLPSADGAVRRPLPNVEDPGAPVLDPEDRPEPAGFGPLSPRWAGRRSKLGTFGEDYLERRWPWFPEDFDWGYFNAAPTALQYPGYLRGDEPLLLENLRPDRPLYASRLPGLRVRCFVTRPAEDGQDRFDELAMRLDTLWIDADKERLVLLWRGWTPVADEDFEEIREVYVAAEPLDEEPLPPEQYRDRLAERLARGSAAPVREGPGGPAAAGPSARPADPAPPDERAPEAPPRDPELDALLQELTGRAHAVTGLDLSAFDLSAPDAASAQIKNYLRSQGIEPDRIPEPTPEQRQAQAALFQELGIPWDPVQGLPDLDRLETLDLEALLRRALQTLDADLESRGLPAREPSALTPEDKESLRALGIDPDPLLAWLASREPAAEPDAGAPPLDREGVQSRATARQSLAGADLSGLDLSGLDLRGADLAGANLSRARLAGAQLGGADLGRATAAGSDLRGARLFGARLAEADLTGADLTGADLTGADLTRVLGERCILREARLYRATAAGAYLVQADLGDIRARGMVLDGAKLRDACLEGADLRRASLREAHLGGANATAALLDYADLSGVRAFDGARLAGASLREISGPESLWMDSDLTGADLSYARLPEADFTGTVLAGAQLGAANLRRARLRKARLQGAGMSEANLFQATLERADLSGVDLRGSNLYGAELLGARFEETDTTGANLKRTKLGGRGS